MVDFCHCPPTPSPAKIILVYSYWPEIFSLQQKISYVNDTNNSFIITLAATLRFGYNIAIAIYVTTWLVF